MEGPFYDPLEQLERLRRRRIKRRQIRRRRRLCTVGTVIVACSATLLFFALGSASARQHVVKTAPTPQAVFAARVRASVAHLVIRRPQVKRMAASASPQTANAAPAVANAPVSAPVPVPPVPAAEPAASSAVCPIPAWLRPSFEQASATSGVRLSLLAAVATAESHFNPDAQSGVGATGVMQLMPATAAALGVDPSDAAENVAGGARYLASLIDRFGSTELALAAYNAGPSAVAAAGGAPSLETLRYVLNVSALDRLDGSCN